MDSSLYNRIVSYFVIIVMLLCNPLEGLSQYQKVRYISVESGTTIVLRLSETLNVSEKGEFGTLRAIVEQNVYSTDGSTIIIKKNTPAYIEYSAELNGAWGKAGEVCLNQAYTSAVNNQNVKLRLGSCKKGGKKVIGVVILSVLFFPIGLFSGFIKGGMPKFENGSTISTTVEDTVIIPCY